MESTTMINKKSVESTGRWIDCSEKKKNYKYKGNRAIRDSNNFTKSPDDVTSSSEILGMSPNLNCIRIITAMRAMFNCTLRENTYCLYNFIIRERLSDKKENLKLKEMEDLMLKEYIKLCK